MKKIMIIDDEPTIAMILSEFLSDHGYDTLTAYSGDEGLELLNRKGPLDLILVDLKMPGTSGKKVVQAIREKPLYKSTPIMVVTGSVKNKTDFPPKDSYQAFVSKPFDLGEILEKVEELIK